FRSVQRLQQSVVIEHGWVLQTAILHQINGGDDLRSLGGTQLQTAHPERQTLSGPVIELPFAIGTSRLTVHDVSEPGNRAVHEHPSQITIRIGTGAGPGKTSRQQGESQARQGETPPRAGATTIAILLIAYPFIYSCSGIARLTLFSRQFNRPISHEA